MASSNPPNTFISKINKSDQHLFHPVDLESHLFDLESDLFDLESDSFQQTGFVVYKMRVVMRHRRAEKQQRAKFCRVLFPFPGLIAALQSDAIGAVHGGANRKVFLSPDWRKSGR